MFDLEYRLRRRRNPRVQLRVIVILLTGLAYIALRPPTAVAQQDVGPVGTEELTSESIEASRKQIEESKEIDEAVKAKVLEQYRMALENLSRAKDFEAKAAQFQKLTDSVPERMLQAKTQLDALKEHPEYDLPVSMSVPELEQELKRKENRLAELKKAFADQEAEPKRRVGRRKEVRTALTSANERLQEIKRQLEQPPPADEPQPLTQARRKELQTRKVAIEREVPAHQNELNMYDAEDAVGLVRQNIDLLAAQIRIEDQEVGELRAFVNKETSAEAQRRIREARLATFGTDPLVRPYAERNEELAQRVKTVIEDKKAADQRLTRIKEQLEELKKQVSRTKEKVKQVGLTVPIGLQLRRQQASLPDIREAHRNVADRQSTIDDAHLALFEYQDERSELATIDPVIERILAQDERQLDDVRRAEIKTAMEDVLSTQKNYLEELVRNYSSYFDTLVELHTEEIALIDETEKFSNYIGERVLWIRTSEMISPAEIQKDAASFEWFINLEHWSEVGTVLWKDATDDPIPLFSALLLFGSLLVLGRSFRQELKEIGQQVHRGNCVVYAPTLRAVLLTTLISLVWPGVVLYFSWRLSNASGASEFVYATALSLGDVARALFFLEVFRHVCRRDGLCEAHFGWSTTGTNVLRVNLRRLEITGMPLLFVAETLHAFDSDHGKDALERLFFIAALVVLSVFVQRVLRPAGGVLEELIEINPGGWVDRLKYVWYVIGCGAPMALATLAFIGYYYTSQQLAQRMFSMVWLILGLLLVRELLLRWILVHHRGLRIDQARERRAAALELAATGGDSAGTAADIPAVSEPEVDLVTVSAQSRRFLHWGLAAVGFVGVWLIYVDVFPALGILDRWPLWYTTVTETDYVMTSDSDETTEFAAPQEHIEAVTLADLAIAALIGIFTIVAARNLPGLLEMSLLGRLPLDAAIRYAITSLASYSIIILGILFAFRAIGIGWLNVQWLAAAVTVGLGFGLQEIFANFVSGLILLFERPLRVGDVITVGNTSGTVSRIRIRATTIVDWDRKELIVPNKEFVTGQLVNWTLTDGTLRVVLKVGIAYGSDTALAYKTLLKVAKENPNVMKDPEPICVFMDFGASSLDFELRAYVPGVDSFIRVRHELNTAIDRAFRDAKIEIAFPQRDLHVRSLPEAFERRLLTNGDGVDGRTPREEAETSKR